MKLINAEKIYITKEKQIIVFDNLNLEFDETTGRFYAIMGDSGSGKSTLIQILGLLDKLTKGQYILNDIDTNKLSEKEKSNIRMKKIGFIFQSFHLNNKFRAYENVMLPMIINSSIPKEERMKKAINLLQKLGLDSRINHFPNEMSGGEQQRVAIARALANDPDIILADEPTGNLDKNNEKEVFKILRELADRGKCVVVVSHNDVVKEYADEVFVMNSHLNERKN